MTFKKIWPKHSQRLTAISDSEGFPEAESNPANNQFLSIYTLTECIHEALWYNFSHCCINKWGIKLALVIKSK
jgi:serine acetyltransferase